MLRGLAFLCEVPGTVLVPNIHELLWSFISTIDQEYVFFRGFTKSFRTQLSFSKLSSNTWHTPQCRRQLAKSPTLILCYPHGLGHRSESPWVQSGPLPVVVNKVLMEHIRAHSFMHCPQLFLCDTAELTNCDQSSDIYTCPFAENSCDCWSKVIISKFTWNYWLLLTPWVQDLYNSNTLFCVLISLIKVEVLASKYFEKKRTIQKYTWWIL